MVPDGGAVARKAVGRDAVTRDGGDDRRRRRLSLGHERRDRDGTAKRDGQGSRPRRGARRCRDRPSTLRAHRHPAWLEADHNGPVEVGPQDAGPCGREPVQRRLGWMTVRIAGPRRGHRDARSNGVHERLGRRGLAPVMGDLQQVDVRQPLGQQLWIDRLLDVAHQQEPTSPDLAEQHDRHVVDAGSAVRRLDRHLAPDRPQDAQRDLVDLQAVSRSDASANRRARPRQPRGPGGISRPGPHHPGFEHPANAVAIEQQREAGHVVLVRMGEDQRVYPSIQRRNVTVERHEQPFGVGAAIDQQAPAP